MHSMSKRARLTLAIALLLSVTACSANGGPNEGPLEVYGWSASMCERDDHEAEVLVGFTKFTNPTDERLTTTGVSLVGDGEWTIVEAAIMPWEYVDDEGRTWVSGIGGGPYNPEPPHRRVKWEEGRIPIPGAVIEPGETVDFGHRTKLIPPAYIDHAEVTYEDESGNEYVAANTLSVNAVHEDGDCDEIPSTPWSEP